MKQVSLFIAAFKVTITSLSRDPLLKLFLILPPAIAIVTVLLIGIQYRTLPPEIPLYYSRPWGEDQLAAPLLLFILPLGIFFWYTASLLLIHFRVKDYPLFTRVLLITQTVTAFCTLIVVGNILALIT